MKAIWRGSSRWRREHRRRALRRSASNAAGTRWVPRAVPCLAIGCAAGDDGAAVRAQRAGFALAIDGSRAPRRAPLAHRTRRTFAMLRAGVLGDAPILARRVQRILGVLGRARLRLVRRAPFALAEIARIRTAPRLAGLEVLVVGVLGRARNFRVVAVTDGAAATLTEAAVALRVGTELFTSGIVDVVRRCRRARLAHRAAPAFAHLAMPRVVAPLLARRRCAVLVDTGAGFEVAGRGRTRGEQQDCAHASCAGCAHTSKPGELRRAQ